MSGSFQTEDLGYFKRATSEDYSFASSVGVHRRCGDEGPGRNPESVGRIGGFRPGRGQRELAYLAEPDRWRLEFMGVARRDLVEWCRSRTLSRWPAERVRSGHGQCDLDAMANNSEWRLVTLINRAQKWTRKRNNGDRQRFFHHNFLFNTGWPITPRQPVNSDVGNGQQEAVRQCIGGRAVIRIATSLAPCASPSSRSQSFHARGRGSTVMFG